METKFAQRLRKKELSNRQIELVVGSLLGDEHLVETTCGFAFRVNHGLKQKQYVDWKYQLIKDFVRTQPQGNDSCYYFRTITHPIFLKLRRVFYQGKRKKIPDKGFLSRYLTPLALAVWLMDDGSRDGNQMRLNSQSFTYRENRILCRFLRAKLGIETTLNRDKGGWRIRLAARSIEKVVKMARRHFIPSMLYKLPL